MSLILAEPTPGATVEAEPDGLWFRARESGTNSRSVWPGYVEIQLDQLLEMGLAQSEGADVCVPYEGFGEIEEREINLTSRWTDWSPYLLKIDRVGDLGRQDFRYRYEFLAGRRPVEVERTGYFVSRTATGRICRLDGQSFALVDAMDRFNALAPEARTTEESWLTFSRVKGCASEVGAALDDALAKNDVVAPSTVGLDLYEDVNGRLSFVPKCEGIPDEEFRAAFLRNPAAEGVYSIDRGGNQRVRIVLGDAQREVLRRMQRVRALDGEAKQRALSDPAAFFDGVIDQVELPYGSRVRGIGPLPPTVIPRAPESGGMARVWRDEGGREADEPRSIAVHATDGTVVAIDLPNRGSQEELRRKVGQAIGRGEVEIEVEGKRVWVDGDLQEALLRVPRMPRTDGSVEKVSQKYLLIYTNEDSVEFEQPKPPGLDGWTGVAAMPAALRPDRDLRRHQRDGIEWLQACASDGSRRGALLADDMGLGKTLQVLAFLAWGIESGRFPDLAGERGPYRPVLIVAPLILLESETWQKEMREFFQHGARSSSRC